MNNSARPGSVADEDSEKDDLSRSKGLSRAGIALALASALGFSTLGIFAATLYGRGFSVPQTLAWRFSAAAVLLWCILGVKAFMEKKRLRPEAAAFDAGRSGAVKTGKAVLGGAGPSDAARRVSSRRVSSRRRALVKLLVLALIGFTPQAGLYFVVLGFLAPGITSLLLYLYPAFVLFLSAVFFRRKPTGAQLVAFAMSFIGCIIIFFQPGDYPFKGLALGVLVALAYGAYLVWGERILTYFEPLFSTAVIMSVAGLFYWVWVLVGAAPVKAPADAVEWLFIAGIALVATVLPITTLFGAMKRAGAANTSLVSTVEPVSTVLLSAFFLGEKITTNRLWGGFFILGGVVLLQLFSSGKIHIKARRRV